MVDYSINGRLYNGSNGDNILTKNKYNVSTKNVTIKSNLHKFTSILFVLALIFGACGVSFGMEKRVPNLGAHANLGAPGKGNNNNFPIFNSNKAPDKKIDYNKAVKIIGAGDGIVNVKTPKVSSEVPLITTRDGKVYGKQLVNELFANKVYIDIYDDIYSNSKVLAFSERDIDPIGETTTYLYSNYKNDIINIKNYLKNNTSEKVLFFKKGLGINDNNNATENVNYIFASVTVDEQEYFIYCSDANSIVEGNGCFGLFNKSQATKIEILSCGNNITNMSNMFFNCSSLTTLNLSNFVTKNVTYMGGMFYNCTSLTTLNLSNFDTKNVTNMGGMFYNCTSLTTLNLSNFDTKNVKGMGGMFYNCTSLTSLDLKNFNTSKVVYMGFMFSFCGSLTSLNLSNFDTKNVTDMSGMFECCVSLEKLDLSNFIVNQVEYMTGMFAGCDSLMNLKLTNFYPKHVKSMDYMFASYNTLRELKTDYNNTSLIPNYSDNIQNMGNILTVLKSEGKDIGGDVVIFCPTAMLELATAYGLIDIDSNKDKNIKNPISKLVCKRHNNKLKVVSQED